jgi:hypothetical protein
MLARLDRVAVETAQEIGFGVRMGLYGCRMLQVDRLIVDARWLPEELQVQAWRRGLIPYVPAHAGVDDTPRNWPLRS